MKCVVCGFDLPSDWPLTKVTGQPGRVAEVAACVPCARRTSVIKSAEGYNRIGAMTR